MNDIENAVSDARSEIYRFKTRVLFDILYRGENVGKVVLKVN